MPDGESFIWRPVERKWITADKLFDGSLLFYDLVLMNEALDVSDENARRIEEARTRK